MRVAARQQRPGLPGAATGTSQLRGQRGMTTHHWKSAVSGRWTTAADWSPAGPVDAATADAVIAVAGSYTVSIVAGTSILLDSLTFAPGTGGTLAIGGTLTLGGTLAEMTQASGVLTLAGTIAGGTMTLNGGILQDSGADVIGAAAILAGGSVEIGSGGTLTLSAAVAWRHADIAGPGTLATTGTTTIGSPVHVDGGLYWLNSGTVLDGAPIDDDAIATTSTLANRFVNTATGTFDLTADGFQAFIDVWNTAPTTLANAGLLEKTAGAGIASIWAAVGSTGTITATAGTLELDFGGILGGTIGGTGAGVVQLAAGPGFVTTGSIAILDGGSFNSLRLVNGADWTDSGTIDDSGNLLLGNGTNVTLAIAAGGTFDFTADDGNILYGGGNTLTNAGLIAKIGGIGTSTIGLGFINTGTVEAASGTLRLLAGVTGGGGLQIGAGSTLELASGALGNSSIVDFAGAGATLKLDKSSTVAKPLANFGAGSRIDFAFAAAVTATISGSMLSVTPAGGTALDFVSSASLAGLYVTTGGDGGTGTVVGLTRSTQIEAGTTLDIAKASAANVTFAGAGALQLDVPTRYTGTFGGLVAGDQIDLQGIAVATKVALSGNDLVVTRSNGTTVSLATSGSLNGLSFVVTKGSTGLNSIITAEAVNTSPVQTINLNQPGATVDTAANVVAEVFGTSAHLSGDTFGGFGGSDLIDFTDLRFATSSFTWAGTAGSGVLTVADGTHTAAITLTGGSTFASAEFGLAPGLHGGTEVLFV